MNLYIGLICNIFSHLISELIFATFPFTDQYDTKVPTVLRQCYCSELEVWHYRTDKSSLVSTVSF